tara:strand:+ start:73 stop:546 length:474 start_codon:yes stop_codon:yes gene_type:complete
MKKIKRREFLNNTCPKVALALLGVSFIESCSKDSDETSINESIGVEDDGGYTVDGKSIEIDLLNPTFVKLNNEGWMNFNAQNILLVKTGSSYFAFNNSCPHQGVRNKWSYNSSEKLFLCGQHNNSYPTDCESIGTNGGPLQCYNTSKAGNTLTITKP